MRATVLVFTFVVGLTGAVQAQERLTDGSERLGRTFDAEIGGRRAREPRVSVPWTIEGLAKGSAATPTPTPTPVFRLSVFPELTRDPETSVGGVGLKYASGRLEVAGTYTHARADGSEGVDAFGTKVKMKVVDQPGGLKVSLVGAQKQKVGQSATYLAVGAASFPLRDDTHVVSNVARVFVDPRAGEARSDWQTSVAALHFPSDRTYLAAEYVLENNLAGEDDFSFTGGYLVQLGARQLDLSLTVGKHGVFSIGLDIPVR